MAKQLLLPAHLKQMFVLLLLLVICVWEGGDETLPPIPAPPPLPSSADFRGLFRPLFKTFCRCVRACVCVFFSQHQLCAF